MRVYLCATEGSHKHLWEYICVPQKDRMNLLWEYICLPQKDRMNICESIFVYHRRIARTFVRVYLCTTEGSHKHLWEYICVPQKDRINNCESIFVFCESIFVYHRRIAWTFCESIFVYHRRIAWTFVRVYLSTTEGSHEHLWEYICVPQKDRINICESIFVCHRRIA